jgi:hypothetical protein
MPIAHLTTREANFPRLGKIRKGAPQTKNEKGKTVMGKDLDHFRLDSDRPHVMRKFQEVYGSEPREINVWLPYQTVQENFDPWMKEYTTGALKRQCDGNNQVIWLEGKSYKGIYNDDAPIPCAKKVGQSCKCKETGQLRVMIRELFQEGIIGYFDVETHSKWDIITLQSNLEAAYRLRPNLCGIPFVLRRSLSNISTPMEDKRVRTDKWLLTIEPDATWVQKQFQDMYQSAIGESAEPIAIPAATELLLEAAVDEEFISRDVALKLWNAAQAIGHDKESAKKVLESFGIESFAEIPIDLTEKIEEAFVSAMPPAKPKRNLMSIVDQIEQNEEAIAVEATVYREPAPALD